MDKPVPKNAGQLSNVLAEKNQESEESDDSN